MGLRLNELSPAEGSRKINFAVVVVSVLVSVKPVVEVSKVKPSRSGSGIRSGFEGGQMPLYRRLPKFGFTSKLAMVTAEVRLSELNQVDGDVVSVESLKAANIIRHDMQRVRIILSGDVTKAYTFKGVKVTKGAKAAIGSSWWYC